MENSSLIDRVFKIYLLLYIHSPNQALFRKQNPLFYLLPGIPFLFCKLLVPSQVNFHIELRVRTLSIIICLPDKSSSYPTTCN